MALGHDGHAEPDAGDAGAGAEAEPTAIATPRRTTCYIEQIWYPWAGQH